jgi:cytochrome c-type biogenesis protein CcmH
MKGLAILTLLLIALGVGGAAAVEPGEMLADPALEARARFISKDIRCVVCQNQSIDDSQADLAADLRRIVRERLVAGDSDQQVRDYLAARYGDFVLLDPPVKPKTYALWYGPVAIFLLALGALLSYFRRRRGAAAAPTSLTPAESRRLKNLLVGDDEPRKSS